MARFVRFLAEGKPAWGSIQEDLVAQLDCAPYENEQPTGKAFPLSGAHLLAPVTPSKIVCVGLNYALHVKESRSATRIPDEPVLFMKPPIAVIGPGENIVYPPSVSRVDYEAELAVVVGRTARNVSPDDALSYVWGYTCLNDVTARDLQKKDVQWTRAKGFDTFCPIGPWVETDLDYVDLTVESYLNGERKQSGHPSEMIFPVPVLLSFISGVMTLLPGDVISTGTPEGVGPMQPGDTIEIRISGLGSLINHLVSS